MQAQNRYEVLITEIMADPSPPAGLPGAEWIELKNVSARPVNLQQWRIGDSGGWSGPLPSLVLQPDSFLILCPASAVAALSAYGTCAALSSFPSLDNDGELLWLRHAAGWTVHAVEYSSQWYNNATKQEGGWSLEMADTQYPCAGAGNWKASVDPAGGTPGKINSVQSPWQDLEPPRLLRSYTRDSSSIILVFDEPVDSTAAADLSHYQLDGGMRCRNATPLPPLFQQVLLTTTAPLQTGTVYTLKAQSVPDCKGNRSGQYAEVKTGLPAAPRPGDCIINEMLFNPRGSGADFVELMNKSPQILDASKIYIANRNGSGMISSVKAISPQPFFIYPGDLVVVTDDRYDLARQYLVAAPGQVLALPSLPSFPDEEGFVLVLEAQGQVLDEVHYRDDWHFALISNPEGISLERIHPGARSQDPSSWHSAASTAGYATPTAVNSQYSNPIPGTTMIHCSPGLFSPDNDGRDDIATIQYTMPEPGYVANITIYDMAGRAVRYLVRNASLGRSGQWYWDGLGEAGKFLPAGPYIVAAECFNLQGKTFRARQVLVLARKLR